MIYVSLLLAGIVGFPLVIIASLGIIVLLVLPVISVCYLKRRKKETDGSVSRRKKTTNRSESASKPLLQTGNWLDDIINAGVMYALDVY